MAQKTYYAGLLKDMFGAKIVLPVFLHCALPVLKHIVILNRTGLGLYKGRFRHPAAEWIDAEGVLLVRGFPLAVMQYQTLEVGSTGDMVLDTKIQGLLQGRPIRCFNGFSDR